MVALQPEHGTCLIRIKDGCTATLATIGEDQVLQLAIKWCEAEEWIGHPEPSDLAVIVRELSEVAKAATAPERHLYVWICQ